MPTIVPTIRRPPTTSAPLAPYVGEPEAMYTHLKTSPTATGSPTTSSPGAIISRNADLVAMSTHCP